MNKIYILLVALMVSFNMLAQSTVENVLSSIEKNNTSLLALRKSIDAQKIGNKMGLSPQNPEVEFNYLWGNPSVIGNRKDFSIKQQFDFPTAYNYKSQLSGLKNSQVELEYQKQKKEILYQVQLLCVEVSYRNALASELITRKTNAEKIANAYKSMFNIGELSVLGYNKSQLNLLQIQKEIEVNEIERNALLAELMQFNGGMRIEYSDGFAVEPLLTTDFEQWYATAEQSNSMLQWIKQGITISNKQKQIASALKLPKLSAGYMSETIVGQQFRGVSVGVSVPLWENKNSVKFAKANTIALQSSELDAKSQFYNRMKALHAKVLSLQNSVTDYRQKLVLYNNAPLLQKALDKGEISYTEYLLELSLYYESVDKLLELEKEKRIAVAELNRYM